MYERSLKQKEDGGTDPRLPGKCSVYLLSEASRGLSGNILSAVWDKYDEFENLEELTSSDIFTMKRVIDSKGGTRVNKDNRT